MRSGVDERGVTELMAVIEHTYALARLHDALLVGLAPPPADDALDADVRAVLAEVRACEAAEPDASWAPRLWEALALNPPILRAIWNKHRVVMAAGTLTPRQKRVAALGTAMHAAARVLQEPLTRLLEREGVGARERVEIAGVIYYFNCLNKLTDGMQVESDILAPGAEPAARREG